MENLTKCKRLLSVLLSINDLYSVQSQLPFSILSSQTERFNLRSVIIQNNVIDGVEVGGSHSNNRSDTPLLPKLSHCFSCEYHGISTCV